MNDNIQPSSEENSPINDSEEKTPSELDTNIKVKQPVDNLEQNRFECRSCGYIYDPIEGNKKLNIPKIPLSKR